MATFAEVRARASRPATRVPICLDGAALDELQALEREFEAAPPPANLGERNPATEIAERIEAVRERMRGSTVDFHLRAWRGRDWAPFYDQRPVQGESEADGAYQDRYFAWVCELVSRTCIDPAMTPEQVAELVDDLPASSWTELVGRSYDINTERVSVPFSAAVSALNLASAAASRRLSESESPTASSLANPHGSDTSTSTPPES